MTSAAPPSHSADASETRAEPTAPTTRLRPVTVGVVAGVTTAVWLFLLSGWLGVEPGRPASVRPDVFFQSDAGDRVQDTILKRSSFGGAIHKLPDVLWPRVAPFAVRQLAPVFGEQPAAVYFSRATAATAVGLGIGYLALVLVRMGLPPVRLLAFAPVWLLATGQVMTCLPDHFALSAGLLPAAFAVFLSRLGKPIVGSAVRLGLLAGLAAGVTATNLLFPVLLFAGLAAHRYRPSWQWYAGVGLVAAVGAAGVVAVTPTFGRQWAMGWQAKSWLNLRLVTDPAGAAKRMARGLIDPAVGPTPVVGRNNWDKVPMLTYEPDGGPYSAWPYDAVRSAAAIAWLILLAAGVRRMTQDEVMRWAVAVLGVWVGWNLVFHNLWGDEFFLYTPHYGWAVLLPGLFVGGVWRLPLLAVGQAVTLWDVRQMAMGIAG